MRGTGHHVPGTHTRAPARDVPQPGGETGGSVSMGGGDAGTRGPRLWQEPPSWAGGDSSACRMQRAGGRGRVYKSFVITGRLREVWGEWRKPEGGQSHPGHRWRAPASPHWETEGDTEARGSLSWSGAVHGWRARLPVLAAVPWAMGLCHLHLPQGHACPPVSLQGGATQCQRFRR